MFIVHGGIIGGAGVGYVGGDGGDAGDAGADDDVGGGGGDYNRMFVGGLRSISLGMDEAALQKLRCCC